MSTSFTPVSLTPTPGFCIKTTTLEPGILPPPSTSPDGNKLSDLKSSSADPALGGLLEPKPQPIIVPKGMKIFVNVCYDKNVPPPPAGSEEAIQRAMKGEDDQRKTDGGEEEDSEEWYVPVVVSEPRTDKDKSGKESVVVDCVYNAEVRKRTLRDPEFKVFLVELGLQRIEAQTGLTLSRSIGTPNIAAKGKLHPRTVRIPTALLANAAAASALDPPHPKSAAELAVSGIAKSTSRNTQGSVSATALMEGGSGNGRNKGKEREKAAKRPLIEEIIAPQSPAAVPTPKSILKPTTTPKPAPKPVAVLSPPPSSDKAGLMPLDVSWNWEKLDSGLLRVTIQVPDLTATSIKSGETYLNIEPRRIILTLPPSSPGGTPRVVDIDRTLSDAQLVSKIHERARAKADFAIAQHRKTTITKPSSLISKAKKAKVKGEEEEDGDAKQLREEIMAESDKEVTKMLLLKRNREFDVDGAKAEWVVKETKLVITL